MMRRITSGRCGPRRRYVLLLAASAAVPGLLSHEVRADKYWINSVTNGNWSLAANWNASSPTGAGGAGIPGFSDNVYISNTTGSAFTITLNETDTIGELDIDNSGGGMDTLSLTSAFSLSTTGAEYVGYGGNGLVNQSAGTVNVGTSGTPQDMYVGYNIGSTGVYNLSSGASLTTTRTEVIGQLGAGSFNQSGGTSTAMYLLLGNSSTGTGTYTLNGAGTLNVIGYEYVGNVGAGAFVQSAGTHTIGTSSTTANFYMGYNSGVSGAYALSGGTLTVYGTENIGYRGNGSFTQSAGTHVIGTPSIPQFFAIGSQLNSTGAYSLSGGTLTVNGFEIVGAGGNGTMTQTNGTQLIGSASYPNSLYVGGGPVSGTNYYTGNGTFSMSGGTLTAGIEYLGNGGNATFNQSGGQNTASYLIFSEYFSGTSTYYSGSTNYVLSGGSLTVTGFESLDGGNSGAFYQSGGTQVIGSIASPQYLEIGGTGTFALTGTGAVTVYGNVNVDDTNSTLPNVLSISGGSMSISGTLDVGASSASNLVSLSGGQLSAGTVNVNGNPSLFSWTGGTLTVGSPVTVGSTASFLGTSLTLSSSMTLNTTGTLINSGKIVSNGGTITAVGAVTNNTLITGYGGISAPGLVNSGQIIQGSGGNLAISVPTSGLANSGVLALATGLQLQLSGAALTNSGLVQLNGGILNGTAPVANTIYGTINGPGVISNTFTNLGTVVVPSGLTILPAFTNNGVIELSSASALLTGGNAITNASTIQGYGTIADPITNNSTIHATGGTLVLTGSVSNSSTGVITAAAGSEVLTQTTNFPTNAGSIALTGGEFSNGGGSLTNTSTGVISGRGTLFTGTLTNNGNLDLSGGFADVYGTVNNGGEIIVSGGSTTTFYNNLAVTTSGVGAMLVDTGSTAVFLGNVTGTSAITGPGTKDFDGTAAGSAIASLVGTTIIGPSAVVSATSVRDKTLNVLGTLTIPSSPAPGTTTATGILTDVYDSGTIDLKNNDLIVSDSTQFSSIQSAITSAYDGGAWDKPGITSSSAKAHASSYGLGYATAGAVHLNTFDGQPVSSGTVLVKYTLLGDALLTGTVGLGDYNAVLANLNTGTLWSQGAFHPGTTTGLADYNAVIANLNQTATGSIANSGFKSASPSLRSITPALSSLRPSLASDLSLNVNTVTGDVYATAGAATALTGYDIFDKSSNFLDSGDPHTDLNELLLSQPTTNRGNTTTFRNATNYKLWNTILDNSSTLAEGENSGKIKQGTASTYDTINIPSGGTIDFGNIYNVAANNKDITFSFSESDPTNGGNPVTGTTYIGGINYVGAPEPGMLGLLGLGGIMMIRQRRESRGEANKA